MPEIRRVRRRSPDVPRTSYAEARVMERAEQLARSVHGFLAVGVCILVTWLVTAPVAHAAAGDITTVAGNGTAALSGDDGPATSASLRGPTGIVAAPGGGYYIADSLNHVVRKVGADGTIRRVAGTGVAGYSGDTGLATAAKLNTPHGLAVMSDGSLLIADAFNDAIRKVSAADGTISTFAGTGPTNSAYNGDNIPATTANLGLPFDVDVASDGSVLIADTFHHRIRQVVGGTITTVAGTGAAGNGGDGGAATAATLNQPFGVSAGPSGTFAIADTGNNRIRDAALGGIIVPIAGDGQAGGSGDGGFPTSARLRAPEGIE